MFEAEGIGSVYYKQDAGCSSLELKMFFSIWGLWLVFYCYQIVALKDVVPT
jgi:hypothetical protein